MIPSTPFSPAKAFVAFARDFFEALAIEDYQTALGRLDSTTKSWPKKELIAKLSEVIGSEHICSAQGFTQSASPKLEEFESTYVLYHRLPIQGRWSKAKAVFEFIKKPGSGYFRVILRGFEP
jgi:hypothetical protein